MRLWTLVKDYQIYISRPNQRAKHEAHFAPTYTDSRPSVLLGAASFVVEQEDYRERETFTHRDCQHRQCCKKLRIAGATHHDSMAKKALIRIPPNTTDSTTILAWECTSAVSVPNQGCLLNYYIAMRTCAPLHYLLQTLNVSFSLPITYWTIPSQHSRLPNECVCKAMR